MDLRPILTIPAVLALSATAAASCPAGAKCMGAAAPDGAAVTPAPSGLPGSIRPVSVSEPGFEPGDILPRGQFDVLTSTAWHGLPPSDGSFWYFKVNHAVLKVNPRTMEVLADVTADAKRVRY